MKVIRGLLFMCAAGLLSAWPWQSIRSHGLGPLGAEPLSWHNEYINQVVGGGNAIYTHPHEVQVSGKKCVAGSSLHFGVRDDLAFDIDEAVEAEIEFYTGDTEEEVRLNYDRADAAPSFEEHEDASASQNIKLPATTAGAFFVQRVLFDRARFANLGFLGTAVCCL